MADFCKQCCKTHLGMDNHTDFKGISTEEDTNNNLYPVVLCEGCGATQVNHLGECVSVDCLEEGHKE